MSSTSRTMASNIIQGWESWQKDLDKVEAEAERVLQDLADEIAIEQDMERRAFEEE